MEPMIITFSAKDLKQSARLQQQISTQMEVIGYHLSEFHATVSKNGTIETTLTLSRGKKS